MDPPLDGAILSPSPPPEEPVVATGVVPLGLRLPGSSPPTSGQQVLFRGPLGKWRS